MTPALRGGNTASLAFGVVDAGGEGVDDRDRVVRHVDEHRGRVMYRLPSTFRPHGRLIAVSGVSSGHTLTAASPALDGPGSRESELSSRACART